MNSEHSRTVGPNRNDRLFAMSIHYSYSSGTAIGVLGVIAEKGVHHITGKMHALFCYYFLSPSFATIAR